MNLYLLEQDLCTGYNTYDQVIVAAPNEESAKLIYPNQYNSVGIRELTQVEDTKRDSWFNWPNHTKYITAKLIGTAIEGTQRGVICASYLAG